ncbi:hypothetical protein ACSV4D_08675 [Flavobacterium sp. ARAG 55.4]|uniref:hypothetical protein n=1 Tax=Flavobacterium sp. ARAG 55.4 TaxID=3451357 RepID=UPI003F45AAD9
MTIFPQAIALGSTFDPKLTERLASAISIEARAQYSIFQKNSNQSMLIPSNPDVKTGTNYPCSLTSLLKSEK